jgi:hypothetical protein
MSAAIAYFALFAIIAFILAVMFDDNDPRFP